MIRRIRIGDVLIAFAVVALVGATVMPTLRARSFRMMLAEVTSSVDSLTAGAERSKARMGAWPQPAARGEMPSELPQAAATSFPMAGDGYDLEWTVWNMVEQVEGPPATITAGEDLPPDSVRPPLMDVVTEVGSVVVHSNDGSLLAELLSRYGDEASFVRDSTWTLVLRPEAGR